MSSQLNFLTIIPPATEIRWEPPTADDAMTIDALHRDSPAEEHLFSNLAYPLLNGQDIDGNWLKLAKLNDPKRKDDDAVYEVDYGLFLDNDLVGYIDVERKISWAKGNWPYPVTNVAKHPLTHWQDGKFNGRLTNKLIRFHEKPLLSFWIGMRNDWQACQVVNAAILFEFGSETNQSTRYSARLLPVIQIANHHCAFCDTPVIFTEYIVSHYRRTLCQRLT